MNGEPEKIKLPENLYNEILKFFRRTSLPRIQKQREFEKAQKDKKDTPSGNMNCSSRNGQEKKHPTE